MGIILKTVYGEISAPNYDGGDLIRDCLLTYGEWGYAEALIASSLVNKGDKFWDVGAHLGTFSLGLAMNCQLDSVVAIEANPSITDYLESNLKNNLQVKYYSNILAGVTSCPGHGLVVLADNANHGSARFVLANHNDQHHSCHIPSITLLELRSQHGNYDFLKLDIEGMELEALQGDSDYIKTYSPVIWAECNECKQSFVLLDKLFELGYSPLYVAFPVIRTEKRQTSRQVVPPIAYEAALVCALPDRLNRLSTLTISDTCIVRKIGNNNDLRQALWDTPRWGRQDWVKLSRPELIARVGHYERGDVYEEFPEDETQITRTDREIRSRNDTLHRRHSFEGVLQVFWAANKEQDAELEFSEWNSQSVVIPVDSSLLTLSFILPTDQGPLRIRFDPLDMIGVVTIENITLVAQKDEVIWLWDRSCSSLLNTSGIFQFPPRSGQSYICASTDPHFEILFPASAFNSGHERLTIEIEIRAETLEQGLTNLIKPVIRNAEDAPPTLLQDIVSLSNLITQILDGRDKTITHQHQQIHQMRNELLRAEAQLDLLKDVMLSSRGVDRL